MEKGLICVSVAAKNPTSVASAVNPVLASVDVVEIRLDAMDIVNVEQCCELIDKPLLFTHRPAWEGGEYHGSEEKRVAPLFEAVKQQVAYIDFELNADARYRNQLLDVMSVTPTRMIISCHDFQHTPDADRLNDILLEEIDSGADIGKIVTVAHDPFDVLRVLNLLEKAAEKNFPLCAFCMGKTGRISRLVTLFFGGFMTYGALNEAQATAPGQLSVNMLNDILKMCHHQLGS
jgi:3-dehydroquinate dehydratase-1/3-dehydroquinate dehydratase/shikimate dehydrogenase